ncbi:MAG: hypothetical protein JWO40_256 [Candidatus Doudnabacteria bacterium]|nr:hypothetical protein [Candidatus Doudnabacteria bacterium]
MQISSMQGKRWFIWTIVFLLVAGVGLVTYITSTDSSNDSYDTTVKHQVTPTTNTPAKTTPVKK